ncbi:MAG: metallophosphoesterase [Eubacteriaceae bacterium]|nr:metallophosphoesterase [Eubacteriaceae bacterium]
MKTGTKRFLSILVVILMLFSVMPAVYAEDIDPAPETESETADRGAASSEGTYAGKVIILHTNDVHGAIDKYAYVAGLKQDFLDKGAEAVLLVDAGDFSQGTVYVSDNQGKNGVIMMNAVGYDIATLGNHEFDYGLAATQSNLDTADFTVVCCNLELEDGSPLTARTQKSVLMSAGGITIGFIGVATPKRGQRQIPLR